MWPLHPNAAFDVSAERLGITIEAGTNEELTTRYNVAPSQEVPIVISSNGGRRLVLAKWGFRPPWINSGTLAPINARAETVATNRLFGTTVRDGRCLIPSTGFYEWKPVPGQRRKQQPYFIRLKGGAPFAFAGLWTPPHLAPPTCTIIVTSANELLAPIHNRILWQRLLGRRRLSLADYVTGTRPPPARPLRRAFVLPILFPLGDAVLTIVGGLTEWTEPGPTSSEKLNALSIVAKLTYRGKSILLTGDTVGRRKGDPTAACKDAEALMVQRHQAGTVSLKADVLQAPHHGGNNGSATCFIQAVAPTFVIFIVNSDACSSTANGRR